MYFRHIGKTILISKVSSHYITTNIATNHVGWHLYKAISREWESSQMHDIKLRAKSYSAISISLFYLSEFFSRAKFQENRCNGSRQNTKDAHNFQHFIGMSTFYLFAIHRLSWNLKIHISARLIIYWTIVSRGKRKLLVYITGKVFLGKSEKYFSQNSPRHIETPTKNYFNNFCELPRFWIQLSLS